MTVPSREAAARLLLSLDPPEWHLRHSRAVAEVAGWLARRADLAASGHGGDVDRRLVESAALLHDVDKAMPRAERGPSPHGAAGAAWLTDRGLGELAEAVSLHSVMVLIDPAATARLHASAPEVRIVAYADKRARQHLVPIGGRFAAWSRRHSGGWGPEVLERAWRESLRLEAEVCELAGCRPADVRRLRWTRELFPPGAR